MALRAGNVKCGTAVRAQYSHKVAPVGVAKPRKLGIMMRIEDCGWWVVEL